MKFLFSDLNKQMLDWEAEEPTGHIQVTLYGYQSKISCEEILVKQKKVDLWLLYIISSHLLLCIRK